MVEPVNGGIPVFHLCASIIVLFVETATTEIYTLSLHDALPIFFLARPAVRNAMNGTLIRELADERSEEHTSELQSPMYLVCRLLLEKKKKTRKVLQMSQTRIAPP